MSNCFNQLVEALLKEANTPTTGFLQRTANNISGIANSNTGKNVKSLGKTALGLGAKAVSSLAGAGIQAAGLAAGVPLPGVKRVTGAAANIIISLLGGIVDFTTGVVKDVAAFLSKRKDAKNLTGKNKCISNAVNEYFEIILNERPQILVGVTKASTRDKIIASYRLAINSLISTLDYTTSTGSRRTHKLTDTTINDFISEVEHRYGQPYIQAFKDFVDMLAAEGVLLSRDILMKNFLDLVELLYNTVK